MRSGLLTDLSRTVRRHRAVLAGLLVAGAVITALPLLSPAPAATTAVLTAVRDLEAGTPLKAEDVRLVAMPRPLVPAGALTDLEAAVGRALGGPVRQGEALTDVRLLGSGLLQTRGLVAVPIRLADSATAALLHAGDRVDVLAAPTGGQAATSAVTVAAGVQVLAVPAGQEGDEGALVVVAATPETASRLAAAAVGARLSVTVLAS